MIIRTNGIVVVTFFRASANDFIASLKLWRMFFFLGWDDIRQRYARTVLGPLWMIFGVATWIGASSFVMAALFNQQVTHTLPFIATGVLIWTFIANILSEGCVLFLQSASIMQAIHFPLLFHVLRFLVRHLITLLHYFLLLFIIFYCCGIRLSWQAWFVLPGLGLLLINALSISCIVGIINTRYRDLQQIITTSLIIIPFITPIFWEKAFLKKHTWIAIFNPFYHAVELVRAPLLGELAAWTSWAFIGAITLLSMTVASYILAKHKNNVIYWL